MDRTTAAPQEVQKILGGKGKKLHAHEIHVRRTENKGYIARHMLRDKHGNYPMDGQRGEAEYALANHDELLSHMKDHMADIPDEEETA